MHHTMTSLLTPHAAAQHPMADTRTKRYAGTAIALRDLGRRFTLGAGQIDALRGITLQVDAGEFVAITGRSGSGKSTLLQLIGGLDRPSLGEVVVAGTALHTLSNDALARWRRTGVGIVFQSFQLLPTLTLLENVMLPMELLPSGTIQARRSRAYELLAAVGLTHRAGSFPAQVSGGEQQRAALARALANDPPLLLADEPTGNLDSQSAATVLDLFSELARQGRTLILATHDPLFAQRADRVVHLVDGTLALGGEN
jgi:putative ABC transport system ATP-binding protein